MQTWKFEHNKNLKDFNKKITWITHLIIVKLQFDKHVEYIELYIHDLKNKYDMMFKFKWLKQHNSQINWIHKTVKFDMQYCWSNCLHKLSWYVHNHDYMNTTWYKLSLFSSMMLLIHSWVMMMLFKNDKQFKNYKKNEFENDIYKQFFKIY